MRTSVTFTDPETGLSYDLDVNSEQKMEETLAILVHARLIGGSYTKEGVRIMSVRTGLIFPASSTYTEAEIYDGDSLRLISPGTDDKDARENGKGKEKKHGKKKNDI